ncbi:MAG: hypothetical protein IKO93_17850, partial [Lentisphaeria bacterium]|nr:hypothetical protein [Lentisphaeria bacterium]
QLAVRGAVRRGLSKDTKNTRNTVEIAHYMAWREISGEQHSPEDSWPCGERCGADFPWTLRILGIQGKSRTTWHDARSLENSILRKTAGRAGSGAARTFQGH